jgi:hypothetical protein
MDVSLDSYAQIRSDIVSRLSETLGDGDLTGISCLARGADSIFAQAVLDSGGKLEIVLPSPNYREKKVKADHAPVFDQLIAQADRVRALPFDEVNKDAYEAANEELIGGCDQLFAVWDGQSSGRSGTATVVEQARARNIPVTVIWPEGASRTKKAV